GSGWQSRLPQVEPKALCHFKRSPEKGPALSGSHCQFVDENYQRKDKAAETHRFRSIILRERTESACVIRDRGVREQTGYAGLGYYWRRLFVSAAALCGSQHRRPAHVALEQRPAPLYLRAQPGRLLHILDVFRFCRLVGAARP